MYYCTRNRKVERNNAKLLFCKDEGLEAVEVGATVVVGTGAWEALQNVVNDNLALSKTSTVGLIYNGNECSCW